MTRLIPSVRRGLLQLRETVLISLTQRFAPRPDPLPPLATKKIVVAGLFGTASGTGESARLCASALASMGYTVRRADLSNSFRQDDFEFKFENAGNCFGPGSLILHVNAPFVPLSLLRLGRRIVRQKRIFGYWAWELPQAPAHWALATKFVHQVLVPSRFTADAIRQITTRPVAVLPHPLLPLTSLSVKRTPRSNYRLPDRSFLVGCIFDMRSSFSRKNVLAAVAAFRQAFGNDLNAHLAIKVAHPDIAPEQKLQLYEATAGLGNVSVHEYVLSPEDQRAWLTNCDTVISLHRSEGFGLVLAEAMQMGKPVVATNWSGNLEFMNSNNSALIDFKLVPARDPQGIYDMPTQHWAEPDVDHAAAWLKKLMGSSELRHIIGERASNEISRLLSVSAYCDRLSNLLGLERQPKGKLDEPREIDAAAGPQI